MKRLSNKWLVRGSGETVQKFSRDRRDEELARQAVNLQFAGAASHLIEGIVFALTGGPGRASRQMELGAELHKLDLECRAFRDAIHAMLHVERERTKQFQVLCRALPHMKPEAHQVAIKILEGLATASLSLPQHE